MLAKKMAAVAAFAGIALAGPASAVVINNGSWDADYINLGNAYNSVGQIYGTSGSGGFAASGVLISQDWVLTAAHVTAGASSLQFYTDQGSTNFWRPNVTADRWYTYPLWDGNLGNGYDIALMHLSTGIGCGTVISEYGGCAAARYTGAGELNGVGTLVGYGTTGVGSTGANTFDGVRRAGINMIDAAYRSPDGGARILLADFDSGSHTDNNFGGAWAFGLESLIGPGDSGGGLFETIDGRSYLTGITSFSWGRLDGNPDSDYGDAAGWTRVSQFNAWIDAVTGANAWAASSNAGAAGGPMLAAAVPEPATWGLLISGIGMLGFVARRRRRAGHA